MSLVEQPEYQIVTAEGSIEIRSYGGMIAAEAEVQGERKTAINEGFRLIAAYIFGANKPNVKIPNRTSAPACYGRSAGSIRVHAEFFLQVAAPPQLTHR